MTLAPELLYDKRPESTYGFRKACEAVRQAVAVEIIARRYTDLESFGGRAWFTGRCPLPEHEDRNPSFYIYPPGKWHCYGCNRGGDVVDLEFFCGDYGELWEAMIALAVEFSVELPRRPQGYMDRKGRHKRLRNAAREIVAERYRRRLFKALILSLLAGIEDPALRECEIRECWEQWCKVHLR